MPSFENEPLRFTSVEEDELTSLTEGDATVLNRDLDYLNDFGILLGDNQQVPKTNDVPRLFMMTKDEDGHERVHSLEEKNIQPGTHAFWNQVQLGNVFAYPAGEEKPVQLQVEKQQNTRPKLFYSAPLEQDEIPFHSVRKPPFYKFWFKKLFKSWGNEVDNYNRFIADKRTALSKLTQHAEARRPHLTEETSQKAQGLQERENARLEKERVKDLVNAREKENETAEKIVFADSVYKPVPHPHPHLVKSPTFKRAFFTQDQFNKLKTYDIDMNSIKAGPKLQPLTDEDFATVAFFAAPQQKYLSATRKLRGGLDPYGPVSLYESGLEPTMEKAQEAYDKVGINFATTDLFVSGFPRESNGVVTEGMIQPAREETFKAFQSYAAGDKEPLAKLIAAGVNYAANEFSSLPASKTLQELGCESSGLSKMTQRLHNLMQKDPDLEILARDNGMKPENLAVVKGAAKLRTLKEACLSAKTKLADAKVNNHNLTEAEKQKCVKDIVKAELAERSYIQDQIKAVEKLDQYNDEHIKPVIQLKNSLEGDGSAPQKGKVWDHTATNHYSIHALENDRPASLKDLSTELGEQKLDMTAEEIIKRENLYQPGQPASSIHENMKNHQYNPVVMMEAANHVRDTLLTKNSEPQVNINPVVSNPAPQMKHDLEL